MAFFEGIDGNPSGYVFHRLESQYTITVSVAPCKIKGYTATSGQKLIFFDLRNADSPCLGSLSV